jgi:hypothetical protein
MKTFARIRSIGMTGVFNPTDCWKFVLASCSLKTPHPYLDNIGISGGFILSLETF